MTGRCGVRSPRAVRRASHLAGISLLEVLITLGLLSLLISLLAPAILRIRSVARRSVCANNLRQLGLAMTAHEQVHRRLPAAGNFEATGTRQYHSWVTSLLASLDQGGLVAQYDWDRAWDDPVNLPLTRLSLDLLVCPDDISVEPGQGNLSYVANGGLAWTVPVDCPASLTTQAEGAVIVPLDLNGNGVVCPLDPQQDGREPDTQILERTSVFFVENWPTGNGTRRSHRLDDFRDGTSQTLLLSENVRAGFDPATGSSWGSPDPRYNSFFVSSSICDKGRCNDGHVDLRRANSRDAEGSKRESLNASRDQPEGNAPWPSSLHGNMINVLFADGHVDTLHEGIDGRVYYRLVTPQGSLLRGPLADGL